MRKKLRFDQRSLLLTLGLLLIGAVALILLAGRSKAKYKTQIVVANQVSYQNELAERFSLLDRPVILREDGSYERDNSAEAEPTSGFSYKLIPGIEIPAAPYIEIEHKTEIPAYLYFEVVCPEGAPELLVSDDWQKLEDTPGKFDGNVYCYQDGTALVGEEGNDSFTIDTFTVQTLDPLPTDFDSGEIRVYAYMIRQVEEQTAKEAFVAAPAPNPAPEQGD